MGLWHSPAQITRFGAAPGGHLSNKAAGQIGGHSCPKIAIVNMLAASSPPMTRSPTSSTAVQGAPFEGDAQGFPVHHQRLPP